MATRVETPYTQRARYYSSLDGFNIQKPAIPAHVFVAERDRAFDAAAPTSLIPCDLSGPLAIGFPATAPFVLARYARIRAGERLATRFAASGALYYVIAGSGETVQGADAIAWDEGDAFCLPGGGEAVHVAGAGDCLLYVVTNEPLLAFERLEPPRPGRAPIEAVHYPADEIQRQLDRIHRLAATTEMPGKSISFGTSGAGCGPRGAAVLHVLDELALAGGDAAAASAQRRRGDARRERRALLLHDRRTAGGLAAVDGDDHAARGDALAPQRRGHARALPHRAGRRAPLPRPDHGVQLLS